MNTRIKTNKHCFALLSWLVLKTSQLSRAINACALGGLHRSPPDDHGDREHRRLAQALQRLPAQPRHLWPLLCHSLLSCYSYTGDCHCGQLTSVIVNLGAAGIVFVTFSCPITLMYRFFFTKCYGIWEEFIYTSILALFDKLSIYHYYLLLLTANFGKYWQFALFDQRERDGRSLANHFCQLIK